MSQPIEKTLENVVDNATIAGSTENAGVESANITSTIEAATAVDGPIADASGNTGMAGSGIVVVNGRVFDPNKRSFEEIVPRELRVQIFEYMAKTQHPRTILIIEDSSKKSKFRLSGKLRPDILSISKLTSEDVGALHMYTPLLKLQGCEDVADFNVDIDTVEIRSATFGIAVRFRHNTNFPFPVGARTEHDLTAGVVDREDLKLVKRLRVDAMCFMNDYINMIHTLRGFANLEQLTIVVTGQVTPGQAPFTADFFMARRGANGFATIFVASALVQLTGQDAMNALFAVVLLRTEQARLSYLCHCIDFAMRDPAFIGLVTVELNYI